MSGFRKLSEAFDRAGEDKKNGDTDTASVKDVGALRRSLVVINTVDKLQQQGIQITKKAKLDYLLALRFVERAGQAAGRDLLEEYRRKGCVSATAEPAADGKRNPEDHPADFEKAFQQSYKVVKEVEEMQRTGKPVSDALLQSYRLCKKFLDQYK